LLLEQQQGFFSFNLCVRHSVDINTITVARATAKECVHFQAMEFATPITNLTGSQPLESTVYTIASAVVVIIIIQQLTRAFDLASSFSLFVSISAVNCNCSCSRCCCSLLSCTYVRSHELISINKKDETTPVLGLTVAGG